MNKIAGIYAICNKKTQRVYVGKSTNIKRRFSRHRSLLNNNKHFNLHLQRAYNKYGSSNFKFMILEECFKLELLAQKEQDWIDNKSPQVYNVDKNVLSNAGKYNGFYGQKHTNETKKKISAYRTGRFVGKENPNFGTVNSLDTRRKMAKNRAKKLLPEDVTKIRKMLANGKLHREIAIQFNISRTIVTRIKSGARYALVGEMV